MAASSAAALFIAWSGQMVKLIPRLPNSSLRRFGVDLFTSHRTLAEILKTVSLNAVIILEVVSDPFQCISLHRLQLSSPSEDALRTRKRDEKDEFLWLGE